MIYYDNAVQALFPSGLFKFSWLENPSLITLSQKPQALYQMQQYEH